MTAPDRLVAILAAYVAGYSRPIGADEEGPLDRLKEWSKTPPHRDGRIETWIEANLRTRTQSPAFPKE
jgi:hypothetical protein